MTEEPKPSAESSSRAPVSRDELRPASIIPLSGAELALGCFWEIMVKRSERPRVTKASVILKVSFLG